MIKKTTKTVKGLARKLFNILTPTVLLIGVGLIATGMTTIYLNTLPSITDLVTRNMYLTQIAVMWMVFIVGIAMHFTLWTDVDEAPGEKLE